MSLVLCNCAACQLYRNPAMRRARVRVKAPSRYIASALPYDVRPGDIVWSKSGAPLVVTEWHMNETHRALFLLEQRQ